jgi:hypothetical protein
LFPFSLFANRAARVLRQAKPGIRKTTLAGACRENRGKAWIARARSINVYFHCQ